MWVFCLHVYVVPHAYLVAEEVRRGHWIPWNWYFTWLWVTTWVLGTETKSSGRAISVLTHWAIPAVLWLLFLMQVWGSNPGPRMCQASTLLLLYTTVLYFHCPVSSNLSFSFLRHNTSFPFITRMQVSRRWKCSSVFKFIIVSFLPAWSVIQEMFSKWLSVRMTQ